LLVPQRWHRVIARLEERDVTRGTTDLRKDGAAALFPLAVLGGGGNGEEAHEPVGQIERFLIDLGFGQGIDAGRDRLPADRLFRSYRRVRDSHLDGERAGVELVQRRHESLAAEPAQPAVEETVWPPGDAVSVQIIGVRVREDGGIGDRVQQSATENDRRASAGLGGGGRWHRLLVDSQRLLQRGGGVLLDDGPALLDERVANAALEGGGVHLDLVAAAAGHRVLVALAASDRIEQRSQPRLG